MLNLAAIFMLMTLCAIVCGTNITDKCLMPTGCTEDSDGILLNIWRPIEASNLTKALRGCVYFLILCYMFVGVSIIADKFMAAIEVITSREKKVRVKKPDGEETTVSVRIWNETVSNLSLMALGSSAPEILLSVIEIVGAGFKAGDLGPGTIVGSAAFNLFVIIGVCVYAIPKGEVRRIEHLRVFICTAAGSILAYIWLYYIIMISSKNKVTVVEATLTFLFFPILVVLAYITDRKIYFMKFLDKKYSAQIVKKDGLSNGNGHNEDVEMQNEKDNPKILQSNGNILDVESSEKDAVVVNGSAIENEAVAQSEKNKRDFIKKLQELRNQNPNADANTISEMAAQDLFKSTPKSRAYYRIAASRKITGSGGNLMKKSLAKHKAATASVEEESDIKAKIIFDPGTYTVMESVGSFECTVVRQSDEPLNFYSYVDFKTVDGSASQGVDFHFAEGTIAFKPEETQKQITIHVIDDDIFEEDEHFSVKLSNLRNSFKPNFVNDEEISCELVKGSDEAAITILDDDHCGIFTFDKEEEEIAENQGEAKIRVTRHSGGRGIVHLPFMTIDGTAKGGGIDYVDTFGELEFVDNETFKIISVKIIDDEEYEKSESFFIEIGLPKHVQKTTTHGAVIYEEDFPKDEKLLNEEQKIAMLGRPRLGNITRCTVNIVENVEFKGAVDKILRETKMGDVLGTTSWKEQFIDAITVGVSAEDDGDEKARPSCTDYIMHFLTVFWKLLFAFVPPTYILDGWACFITSICGIGFMTAIIGDLATHFGCTIGLRDSVTAISIVALGTSVPDLFASKTAAVGDSNADASIGNVTGSNAVNVFLGIGIAWSAAAIYHQIKGTPEGFHVDAGDLGFSVTLFCILAAIAIAILMLRRLLPSIGGELGGPTSIKCITAIIFVCLWFIYIALSSLVSYCIITPSF